MLKAADKCFNQARILMIFNVINSYERNEYAAQIRINFFSSSRFLPLAFEFVQKTALFVFRGTAIKGRSSYIVVKLALYRRELLR